jgi:hypothetical protein
MRQATGKFFSMYVPATFQERRVPLPVPLTHNELVTFDAPSSKPGNVVRVVVETFRPHA